MIIPLSVLFVFQKKIIFLIPHHRCLRGYRLHQQNNKRILKIMLRLFLFFCKASLQSLNSQCLYCTSCDYIWTNQVIPNLPANVGQCNRFPERNKIEIHLYFMSDAEGTQKHRSLFCLKKEITICFVQGEILTLS